jgi:hypothetical protein
MLAATDVRRRLASRNRQSWLLLKEERLAESETQEKERMKSMLKTLGAVALTTVMVLPVLADDATSTTDAKDQKDLKKVIEDQGINYVETAQKGITLSGYVDVSYTEQFAGRGVAFGSSTELHQFDVHNDNFNVNAVKVALEKALPDKNDWAAGFRIDTIYGQDAQALNAGSGGNVFGSFSSSSSGSGSTTSVTSSSDFYLEQALVKFRIPVGNGLDIYAGKFVTFLGYEVIESPANPNFSRSLLFTNAIPLTHTGVYADYKFNDEVEAKLGVVDGWNTSVSQASSDRNATYSFGGKALTGQINITNPGKNANICQSFIYSPDSTEPAGVNGGGDNGPSVVYDIWGNWSPVFVKDSALTLGFNIDFGYSGATGYPANVNGVGGTYDSSTWAGIALYAQYKFNKVFSLDGRAEYLHEDSAWNPKFGSTGLTTTNNRFTDDRSTFTPAQDDFEYTLTATFNIWDNLLTRAEYRIDVASAGSSFSNTDSDTDATHIYKSSVANEISLEAVYSF